MNIHYNVSGQRRKELVQAISGLIGEESRYLRVPSCAYQIGANYTVTKEGNLEIDESVETANVKVLFENLRAEGFTPDGPAETLALLDEEPPAEKDEPTVNSGTEAEEESPQEPPTLEDEAEKKPEEESFNGEISIPRDEALDDALDRLDALLESKQQLICHSFGIDEATYRLEDDRITFPWLPGAEAVDPDRWHAAMTFITALVDLAKNLHRVTAKARAVDNEKYAFRCFLIRLGLNGPAYKMDRKVLLRNLSGSSAFKSGHKKEEAGGHDETAD